MVAAVKEPLTVEHFMTNEFWQYVDAIFGQNRAIVETLGANPSEEEYLQARPLTLVLQNSLQLLSTLDNSERGRFVIAELRKTILKSTEFVHPLTLEAYPSIFYTNKFDELFDFDC